MKKLLFVLFAIILFAACAVSASAAQTPVDMVLTATPEKIIYTSADAVERTENVWDEATQTVVQKTYSYYPIDFTGLEITFSYEDETTSVFCFDDNKSLVWDYVTIQNKTVQNADNPWVAGQSYTVVLSFADKSVEYTVLVVDLKPDVENAIISFEIAENPEKTVYPDTQAFTASDFDALGNVKTYDAYNVELNGIIFKLTYEDGSILFCTPEQLFALTGEKIRVTDGQSAATPWKKGANTIDIAFGSFSDNLTVYVDVEGHKVNAYVSNGDDTHSGVCEYCMQTVTFDCTDGTATCTEKAVCAVCESTYGELLPHDVVYTFNAEKHTGACTVCDYATSEETHTYESGPYDTEQKRALYTCTVCGYTVYGQPLGDLNEDGKLTVADARLALRAAVGLETFDETKTRLADMDADGTVLVSDARLLLRMSVGLDSANGFIPLQPESPTEGEE